MSIRLHPQHGLNPTVPTCFWCGESKNEVALLGAAYKGEAPMRLCLDYEPCPKCIENMEKGVTIAEVEARAIDGRPPIQRNPDLYPTGRWVVVRREAIPNIFKLKETADEIAAKGKAFCDREVFESVFVPACKGESDEA